MSDGSRSSDDRPSTDDYRDALAILRFERDDALEEVGRLRRELALAHAALAEYLAEEQGDVP